MYRIDNASATGSKPARGAVGPNVDGYFQETDPAGGTVRPADYDNAVQDELCNIIESRNTTLDKADDTQLLTAILDMIQSDGSGAGAVVNPFMNYAHFRDEKDAGTSGGSFGSSNNLVTRDLNEEKSNYINGCSLSGNAITLPAGTYRVNASVPAYSVDGVRAFIYDTTSSAIVAYSTTDNGSTTTASGLTNLIKGEFSLSTESIIEIRQIASQLGGGSEGLGKPYSVAFNPALTFKEVYTDVEIWKVG